ncbi:amidohydrolase family protein [Salinibacterium sp. NSLL150]|uniref:amidohydrolase family protein n=1 Tax=unclassified Salinibacterium TaxID=2632331 RepID=UPI0018CF53BC|nr:MULTISPECIES: amidohydrolase family protein [unclassified Salinibacterium]MBH0097829.1 amidohydrolase family protein [Salinibacterium sp. NSLL35]MBH0100584.1 amidohydrolase family protein [Salinibacterium sp. NSLL150]MBH0103343.1 amidohydrolase family protein [Salinibacterium sp. NSLL16]MBH0106104.1 amidohydrolase family protein [Salinibacterium sp. NSLL17]
MVFPIIDAHQHIWNPNRAHYDWLDESLAPINQVMTLDQLLPELRDVGVDYTVQVQSADNFDDTRLMTECAAANHEVAAIVGYAPLDRPAQAARTIESWEGDTRMVGVRTLIHNQEDPEWLLRPNVDEGLTVLERAGLTFDVVAVLPEHLALIPELSRRHPELRMVIDHLAKPPIGLEEREPWWSAIEAAAENPNVYAKVSGLYSAAGDPQQWTTEYVRPFFERALEVFGAKRLMYGGDWPISVLAGGYTRVWQGLQPLFDSVDAVDREQLLGRTAAEFYRIDPARIGY